MTTLRLSPSQKRILERARKIFEARAGRAISQGEMVERLSEFALDERELWAQTADSGDSLKDDPIFDYRLTFSAGKTDASTVDRVLYGRR